MPTADGHARALLTAGWLVGRALELERDGRTGTRSIRPRVAVATVAVRVPKVRP